MGIQTSLLACKLQLSSSSIQQLLRICHMDLKEVTLTSDAQIHVNKEAADRVFCWSPWYNTSHPPERFPLSELITTREC